MVKSDWVSSIIWESKHKVDLEQNTSMIAPPEYSDKGVTCLEQHGNEVAIILLFTQKTQFSFQKLLNPVIKVNNSHYVE